MENKKQELTPIDNNSVKAASYNFACGLCKNCKHWGEPGFGPGESNESNCHRIGGPKGQSQFIDNENWYEMPGAFIWLQTETEDGLGGEIIGIEGEEVYINNPLINYRYREKLELFFMTTADFGCRLFKSKQ